MMAAEIMKAQECPTKVSRPPSQPANQVEQASFVNPMQGYPIFCDPESQCMHCLSYS